MEEETPPVRLRLVFDARDLLKKAQQEDGLRRCWLLLRPELATVADLAAHVARRFRLRRSCPDGIILSMDEFVLPPFESTSIFRDKDIVRVKRKICKKKTVEHNDVHFIQDSEIVEKLPIPTKDEILAIEPPEDSGRIQREKKQSASQHEGNSTLTPTPEVEVMNSKRKHQDMEKAQGSKKKSKVIDPEEPINSSKKYEHVHPDQDQNCSKKIRSSQQNCTKGLLSVGTETMKAFPQTADNILCKEVQNMRSNQTELNCQTKTTDPNAESAFPKPRSRSAYRKKLKRQLRAIMRKKENPQSQTSPCIIDRPTSSNPNGLHCPSSSNPNGLHRPSSSNPNGLHRPSSGREASQQESDTSDEAVPVVVRPGHIRFESTGEPSKTQANEPQMTLQWSGTMSKKKGQKWGMNNSNRKNIDSSYYGRTNRTKDGTNHHLMDNRTKENGFCRTGNQNNTDGSYDESASKILISEEGKSINEHLDFESLYPLTRLPKEGDLIVYRLVELSSSWCPELSPYRVGEVLIYDPISMRIILLPVPDYPFFSEEIGGEDEPDMRSDLSLYKEDGSLEIEYSSLIDVRLLKDSGSELATASKVRSGTGMKGELQINKQVTLAKDKGIISNPEMPLLQGSPKYSVDLGKNKGKINNQEVPLVQGSPNALVDLGKNKGKIDNREVPLVQNGGKDLVDLAKSKGKIDNREVPLLQKDQEVLPEKGAWEEGGEAISDKRGEIQDNGWAAWKPNNSAATTSTSSWSYRALRGRALGPTVAFLRGGKNNRRGKFSNPKFRK